VSEAFVKNSMSDSDEEVFEASMRARRCYEHHKLCELNSTYSCLPQVERIVDMKGKAMADGSFVLKYQVRWKGYKAIDVRYPSYVCCCCASLTSPNSVRTLGSRLPTWRKTYVSLSFCYAFEMPPTIASPLRKKTCCEPSREH
jgi:hypothetical protein